jgi:hypothetical protein
VHEGCRDCPVRDDAERLIERDRPLEGDLDLLSQMLAKQPDAVTSVSRPRRATETASDLDDIGRDFVFEKMGGV